MATFKIHQDQENQPQKNLAVGKMAHPKRAAMGEVVSNKLNNYVQFPKKKEPLGLSSLQNKANIENNAEKWCNKQQDKDGCKNIVNPIVPVAQFEAFKVYEDEEEKHARMDSALEAMSKSSNVYKGDEERLYTKTEVRHLRRMGLLPNSPPIEQTPCTPLCPMSLGKDLELENSFNESILRRNLKAEEEEFFDMNEYKMDIYKYLREHELNNRAKPGYIRKQPDVTSLMRTILVDWLVEVVEEYKLQTETLYLAVNYIDRFLSYMSVVRAKLQLVGTAAMFLASKYEEIYPPDIGEFVYITDDTYTKRQVVRMENLIVKVLSFDLSVPTPLSFITSMCCILKTDIKVKFLAMYTCELSMLEGETYLEFLPSQLAASSILIAYHVLNHQLNYQQFTKELGYEIDELYLCTKHVYDMYVVAPTYPQHAIQDKYKSQKYLHVSQIEPEHQAHESFWSSLKKLKARSIYH